MSDTAVLAGGAKAATKTGAAQAALAARLDALQDSLENPKSTALAASIKSELAKLNDELEVARLLEIATATKAEAKRRDEEAQKAAWAVSHSKVWRQKNRLPRQNARAPKPIKSRYAQR